MRIFTLAKKEIPLFFFAFLFFGTTYSIYGQCPVDVPDYQEFCDTQLAEVGDLDTGTETNVVWFENQTTTTPLDFEEPLKDGTYYPGTSDGSCAPADRPAVTVKIHGAPKLNYSNTDVCLKPGETMRLDQIGSDVPVTWYKNDLTKNGTDEVLDETVERGAGTYYAGVAGLDCRTSRTMLVVSQPTAPNADSYQEFCAVNDPLTQDIIADGNNKYYESENDSEALGNNHPLEDGKTYYISKVEGCESVERTAVTVKIWDLKINNETQTFCASTGSGDTIERPTVADLKPVGGTWYAHIDAQKNNENPLNADEILVDGENYYLRIPDGECETTEVIVSLTPPPNAGADTEVSFCVNDNTTYNLVDFIEPSEAGEADQTGTFNPALENNEFNPSEYSTDETYTFIYTVEPTSPCSEAASSTIIVTINEAPDAGSSPQASRCYAQVATQENFLEVFNEIIGERDENGVFNPTKEELYSEISGAGNVTATYETTFTVTDPNTSCKDIATISLKIDQSPNAGQGPSSPVEICSLDAPFDLFDHLTNNDFGAPQTGGIISPELAGGGTMFDPGNDESGVYTYTVENNNCGSSTATIEVVVTPIAYAGVDMTIDFCSSEGPQDLFLYLEELEISTEGSFDNLPDGMFDPSQHGVGELETVYRVEPIAGCGDAHEATYTLKVNETPPAPEATGVTACASEFLTVGDLQVTAETGATIQWYTDAELTLPAKETDLLVSGNYYVTQSNATACESSSAMVTANIPDAPTPSLGQDGNIFCSYDRPTLAQLDQNMEDRDVTWYDAATGGQVLNLSDRLVNGVTYYASLTNTASGCESSERLPVKAVLETCELPFPDAFTPNGDGMNDTFQIQFAEQEYPNYTLEIYNRWGNLVFKGDASKHWDGTSSESRTIGDKILPVGVYFYILYYNDGQTAPSQGRVYLSR